MQEPPLALLSPCLYHQPGRIMSFKMPLHLPTIEAALDSLGAGHPDQTEALARAALAERPGDPTWTTLLALALSAQRRPDEALPLYRALAAWQPDESTHWANLGNCLCELERETEAAPALARARALGADDDAVHFGLARVHAETGPLSTALSHMDAAIERAPDDLEYRLFRARLLAAGERWGLAADDVARLQAAQLDPWQRSDLGYLLMRTGHYDQAIAIFQDAPDDPLLAIDFSIGLATAWERINRVDDAVALRTNLRKLPQHAPASLRDKRLHLDARLASRRGDHAQAASLLREQIAAAPDHPLRFSSQWFDLGTALDRLGDADGAMAAFAKAHASQCAAIDPAHPSIVSDTGIPALLELSPPTPDGEVFEVDDGLPDPVFVVGFPRSGTTLLEQLLDAHPALVSFDEQPFLQRLFLMLAERAGDATRAGDALNADTVRMLRAHYAEMVAGVAGDLAGRRPVDKNPLNMVRLPWLQQVFPRAKVVLAIRHPCDVVFSCYMQNFRSPVLATRFRTLESAADFYDRVFAFWDRHAGDLRLPVHILRNEDLIGDTEGRARALFDFLELPWQDDLLAFTERAKAKGAIKTPSYTQVVEKVNAKAVGRWQRYRAHFPESALKKLAHWADRFAYPAFD